MIGLGVLGRVRVLVGLRLAKKLFEGKSEVSVRIRILFGFYEWSRSAFLGGSFSFLKPLDRVWSPCVS